MTIVVVSEDAGGGWKRGGGKGVSQVLLSCLPVASLSLRPSPFCNSEQQQVPDHTTRPSTPSRTSLLTGAAIPGSRCHPGPSRRASRVFPGRAGGESAMVPTRCIGGSGGVHWAGLGGRGGTRPPPSAPPSNPSPQSSPNGPLNSPASPHPPPRHLLSSAVASGPVDFLNPSGPLPPPFPAGNSTPCGSLQLTPSTPPFHPLTPFAPPARTRAEEPKDFSLARICHFYD